MFVVTCVDDREAPGLCVSESDVQIFDYGVELAAGDARRNIVTRGVALNHLVGKEFTVGNVRIRGIRLCEPCDHLERLTGKPVLKGLLHRGGLRAQILTEGTIHAGDEVVTTW